MDRDMFQKFSRETLESILKIIEASMDDFLYVFDLKNNKMEISESAVDRFNITSEYFDDAFHQVLPVVYEEDRELLASHLNDVIAGREKEHNLHYRWLDKEGKPVWINCRGLVIHDEQGNASYLVGCLNETGNKRRADNVTGLLGVMEFTSYLRSKKDSVSKGFLMHIGIDNLGTINSTHGWDHGDYILKGVADCMKRCLSDKQRIYHIVADQYVIVDLNSDSRDQVMELRSKICEEIYKFIIADKYEAIFSISIGVIDAATYLEGYEEWRRKFEFALKKAKRMGENSIYFFRNEDYEDFLRKRKIIGALRNAVADQHEGFEVYYQPIVDCESGNMVGAEALMRFSMMSEGRIETISPIEFIPLLEESGLIIPAGRFVLSEAARMCAEMQKYVKGFKMNINLSYIQIMQGNIDSDILSVIRKYSLKPESLCVELTESGFVDLTPAFGRFRETLEKNHIQFVIDDFGTGYSNLHCISDMDPSYVKIDRSFTARAMCNRRDFEIFKNIITLVHSINARVCIEGIEKKEWCECMNNMQVDYLQGYFFGRPCNRKEFLEKAMPIKA